MGTRIRNDETGEELEWDGTQWAPITAANVVPFDAALDNARGAPASVRGAVGAAVSPEDRLGTLQQFYPDARPYMDDNFVFTDPESGRANIYNPPGLDLGDAASLGPEMAEMLGGGIGGALATGGAVPTGGASLLAVPAGVGLGAAAGREAYNTLAEVLMGTKDTRGFPEQMMDVGVTAGMNAVGQRVGDMVGGAGRTMFGNVERPAFTGASPQQLRSSFQQLGVPPMAGAITRNRATQMLEQGLANTPGGGSVMQKAAQDAVEQLGGAVDDISRGYAGGRERLSPQGIGHLLQEAAKGAQGRFQATQERIYSGIFARVPQGSQVPLTRSEALLGAIRGEIAGAPQSLSPNAREAIGRLEAALADAQAGGGGIDFATFRKIRSELGKDIGDAPLLGRNTAANQYLQRMYGALSDDMNAFLVQTDPSLAQSLFTIDRYTRFNMTQNMGLLNKVIDQGTPEQAYRLAMSGTRDGGTTLRRLRRNMTSEEWDMVAGSTLGRLGLATPANQGDTAVDEAADVFSPATFITNYNRLSREARHFLFSGTRYAELRANLDRAVEVAAALRDAERMGNPSGTARTVMVSLGLYQAGRQLVAGDVTGAAGLVAGGIITPRVAAKLMTNPKFVNWLTDTIRPGQRGRGQDMAGVLSRLAAVGVANPEIRDEVHQYLEALRDAPDLGSAIEATVLQ